MSFQQKCVGLSSLSLTVFIVVRIPWLRSFELLYKPHNLLRGYFSLGPRKSALYSWATDIWSLMFRPSIYINRVLDFVNFAPWEIFPRYPQTVPRVVTSIELVASFARPTFVVACCLHFNATQQQRVVHKNNSKWAFLYYKPNLKCNMYTVNGNIIVSILERIRLVWFLGHYWHLVV